MADLIVWPDQTPKNEPQSRSSLNPNPIILFVDDDARMRELYEQHFRPLGYKIKLAENGARAAQAIFHGEAIDVVVMDLMMPQVDGNLSIEVLQEVKPDLPIIVASGYVTSEQVERGIAGAVAVEGKL